MKNKILPVLLSAIIFSAPAIADGTTKIASQAPVQEIVAVNDIQLSTINYQWWTSYGDEHLNYYIKKALSANNDLKIASLRVLEYQQMVKASFGKELPLLTIGGNAQSQKYSKNYMPIFSGTIDNYSFPLTASYELDLWGKNRSITKSAKKQLEAVQYNEKTSMISISANVASLYFNILKTNKVIDLEKQIVKIKQEKLKMVESKIAAGVGTDDEIIARKKELADAQVTLNQLENAKGTLLTALATLTGDSAENISEYKFGSIDTYKDFKVSVSPVNSEQIMQRPDILQAEALLNKAKIDVSTARKEFLPTLKISGQAGFNSKYLGNIFDGNSLTYTYGGSILETIFSGGQRRANLKSKKYVYDENIQSYQKAILTSLKEVNDALLAVKTSDANSQEKAKKLSLEKNNLKLATNRYEVGTNSYYDTLSPQENLLSSQIDFFSTKTDSIIDNFTLYKALGGNI